VLVFAKAFKVFLSEENTTLPKTMAVLDRELNRGDWVLKRAEGAMRLAAPLRGFCQALRQTRRERASA
jgi:hypothetical protein